MGQPRHLFVYFCSFQILLNRKIVDLAGFELRVQGQHADHLTSPTATNWKLFVENTKIKRGRNGPFLKTVDFRKAAALRSKFLFKCFTIFLTQIFSISLGASQGFKARQVKLTQGNIFKMINSWPLFFFLLYFQYSLTVNKCSTKIFVNDGFESCVGCNHAAN